MNTTRYADPARPTRRWITAGLALGGALAGAAFGGALTVLGKIVTGAPPADLANYLWNAGVFGAIGACIAPAVTWSAFRHVPLWRTVAEPVAGALLGAGVGVLVASPAAFLLLVPVGAAAAIARMELAHRPRQLSR